jgi:threonine dehydrogenase-like Zn-dependent dehydrogenase
MDLRTVAGDGTAGLLGAPSATLMASEPIITMSRHETRRKLALECGATDIVTERDDEGVARIKETSFLGSTTEFLLEPFNPDPMSAGHNRHRRSIRRWDNANQEMVTLGRSISFVCGRTPSAQP